MTDNINCNIVKQMDNINLTDTDTDTENSVELNDVEIIENRALNATHNATKSLFNITIDNLSDQHISLECKNYENRLNKEMSEWKTLVSELYTNLKKSKEKHAKVDKTILSKEKLEYLDKAPCLQRFIHDSIEFRQRSHIFIEFHYAEIKDMIDNLNDLVERQTNIVKTNTISENLANITKNNTFQDKEKKVHKILNNKNE